MSIEVKNLVKRFGAVTVCDHLNLDIPSGELVALLGPSGSGKTSLLRIIAGLETPDQGSVLFHGEDATNVSVRDRNVGFVFQHYALFGHMSIFENVAFGLRVRPKAMTVAVILAGLLPIMWGAGTGSEVMQRIAAPMVGGMITAPLLSMFVIPAAYLLIRRSKKARRATQAPHMKHA